MKKAKALLTLALAIAMVASICCVPALAAEEDSKTFYGWEGESVTFDQDGKLVDDTNWSIIEVPVGTTATFKLKEGEYDGWSVAGKTVDGPLTWKLDQVGSYWINMPSDMTAFEIRVTMALPEEPFEVTESSSVFKVNYWDYSDGSKFVEGDKQTVKTYTVTDSATGGTDTYIRIRDFAEVVKKAHKISVNWTRGEKGGTVSIGSGEYVPNGTELDNIPFSGTQTAKPANVVTEIDGETADIQSFTITDANGGNHTFYSINDLANALYLRMYSEDGVITIR